MHCIQTRLIRLGIFVCAVGLIVGGALSLGPTTPALSQADSCSQMVDQALQLVGSSCAVVGLNEVCYGHTLVSATFREGVDVLPFNTAGDTAQLVNLQALVTEPADPAAGTWGVALMKIQADLPAEAGGMTMMLFGDTEVVNQTEAGAAGPSCTLTTRNNNVNIRSGPGEGFGIIDVLRPGVSILATGHNISGGWVRVDYNGTVGWVWEPAVLVDCEVASLPAAEPGDAVAAARPMQAFTLRGGGDSACEQAPNGLLVRSPKGERANVVVNGVQLEFSSAAFLTAIPDESIMVVGLEGAIAVTAFGRTVTVTPGMETGVPMVGLEAAGEPHDLKPVNKPRLLDLLSATVPDAVVNTDTLNVRANPGDGAPILTSVPRNTPLTIIARLVDNTWVKVRLQNGVEGWVYAPLLIINIDLTRVPVLSLPLILPAAPTVPPPPPPPTAIPITPTVPLPALAVSFYSDLTCVDPQNPCTTLHWDVEGVREVYYQGTGVVGHGSQQECPQGPTSYTLTVVTPAGERIPYSAYVTYNSYSCTQPLPNQEVTAEVPILY